MSLTGIWINQLNSKMDLKDDGEGGLTGTYTSTVGRFHGISFALKGSYDSRPHARVAIGFVVGWIDEGHNANSVTTWCGQLDSPNEHIIETQWLLTAGGALEKWQSTLVGHDQFSLVPLGEDVAMIAEEVVQRNLLAGSSHPM